MGIPGMSPMPYMVGAPPPILGGVMPMAHVSIRHKHIFNVAVLVRSIVVVYFVCWVYVSGRLRWKDFFLEVSSALRELCTKL